MSLAHKLFLLEGHAAGLRNIVVPEVRRSAAINGAMGACRCVSSLADFVFSEPEYVRAFAAVRAICEAAHPDGVPAGAGYAGPCGIGALLQEARRLLDGAPAVTPRMAEIARMLPLVRDLAKLKPARGEAPSPTPPEATMSSSAATPAAAAAPNGVFALACLSQVSEHTVFTAKRAITAAHIVAAGPLSDAQTAELLDQLSSIAARLPADGSCDREAIELQQIADDLLERDAAPAENPPAENPPAENPPTEAMPVAPLEDLLAPPAALPTISSAALAPAADAHPATPAGAEESSVPDDAAEYGEVVDDPAALTEALCAIYCAAAEAAGAGDMPRADWLMRNADHGLFCDIALEGQVLAACLAARDAFARAATAAIQAGNDSTVVGWLDLAEKAASAAAAAAADDDDDGDDDSAPPIIESTRRAAKAIAGQIEQASYTSDSVKLSVALRSLDH